MLLVSDVHGAFDALAAAASTGEPLLVLGDLLNLMDYRTGEGITADVMGIDFAREAADARARGDYAHMRSMWRDRVGDRSAEIRERYTEAAEAQYREAAEALRGANAYVTFGNVDRPSLLRASLPEGVRFVDGESFEVEGVRIGMVGGGIATPIGAEGEVSDDDMREKLARMGPVDVLCSHLPPDVRPLHHDVVTGRDERASQPIREYLLEHRPQRHFFGDVHQPQALTWRVGETICRNVGYFRATRRVVRFEPDST
jgi:Icc-related predicted phosphoesterase